MAIATYSELKTAITTWAHRSDLSTIAADCIALAEAKFNRQIRHPKMETRSQATVGSNGWIGIPSDFLELRALEVDSRRIPQKPYDWLDDEYGTNTGDTECFAFADEQFRIAPYTSGDIVEILYYRTIPALSDSNTTNWLLTNSPDLYFYASMVEASNYTRNDSELAKYAALASQAMRDLEEDGARRRHGENSLELSVFVPTTGRTFDINRGY